MAVRSGSNSVPARNAVVEAVRDWRRRQRVDAQQNRALPLERPAGEVLAGMPRRQQLPQQDGQIWLPYIETHAHRAGFWRSLGRLFAWLTVLATILRGNFVDWILRRDSPERRAARLRQALEKAGGTFVKLGQQMAMRVDLLPWAYCVELAKMLDQMVPFPTEHALAAIERTVGRPWPEVFAVLDPKPIGSASIACVYQAVLKNGTKVVVKVRRPGIRDVFLADLRVLDWLSELAEFLTIVRSGFTRKLRVELRDILMEELDFKREGRFQDIFRRNAEKTGWKFFTAPKVHFELSGDEVLVQEFVSGLWLWEVIAIIEQRDPRGLALLRRMKIDPRVVARRLLIATFWSMDEHVFFHADPHPANILVRADNRITFIDFGSCGSFNNQQRIALEQMVLSMQRQDVEGMTRAVINLMEPLPPIDVPSLIKQAQEEYMHVLHTFNTPAEYTQYWERTSARQWYVLIQVARRFNLPVNLHMLRMIRATLLYDSIVLRLDNQLDRYHEYMEFMKIRARLVKRRWRRDLRERSGDGFFLTLEELGHSFNDLMIRAQVVLSRPVVTFGPTVDKWVFTTSVVSRMVGRILLLTFVLTGLLQLVWNLAGQGAPVASALNTVIHSPFYLAFVVLTSIFSLRLILFRLTDRDEGSNIRN